MHDPNSGLKASCYRNCVRKAQSCGTSGSMVSLLVSCPRGGNSSPPVWQVCRVKTNNSDTTHSACELYHCCWSPVLIQGWFKTTCVATRERMSTLAPYCNCVAIAYNQWLCHPPLPPSHACAAVCHQMHESITRNAHNFTLTSDLCELFICVPLANNSIPWQSCAEDVWSSKSRVSGEVVVNKHQSSCTLACRPCLWRSNRTTVAPTAITIVNFSKNKSLTQFFLHSSPNMAANLLQWSCHCARHLF